MTDAGPRYLPGAPMGLGSRMPSTDASTASALQDADRRYAKGLTEGTTAYPVPVAPGVVDKSNWGTRYGSGEQKGTGFLGVLSRPDGGVSSELSIGVNIDGKEVEVPSMVPTLTQQQRQQLLALKDGERMPQSIVDAATEYARQRIAAGKSPFASDAESPDNVSLDDAYAKQQRGY